MSALRELADTRQIPGEPRRRWFCSPELDLIVWLDDDEELLGFQLCYDKHASERALTWRAGRGYDHAAVDAGETRPSKYKSTPILVANGAFQHERVSAIFRDASLEVPEHIRAFVAQAIENYPRG